MSKKRFASNSASDSIGIVVVGSFLDRADELLDNVVAIAEESNYNVFVMHEQSGHPDLMKIGHFVIEQRLRGVLCIGGDFNEISKEALGGLSYRMVVAAANLGANTKSPYIATVGINNYNAAYSQLNMALHKNVKQVLVVVGDQEEEGTAMQRLRGYYHALEDGDIASSNSFVVDGKYSCETAYNVTKGMLDMHKNINSIVCQNDIMAPGIAKAVIDSGRALGSDVMLISFGGAGYVKHYNPAITTVNIPVEIIADKSVNMLKDLVDNNIQNDHITVKTSLFAGDTCFQMNDFNC